MLASALSTALERRGFHAPVLGRWPLAGVLLPLGGAALGGAAIGLQYLHAGSRPFPSTVLFLVASAAALAPLRVALPVAVGLACFQSTIGDFFGSPARYWKEAFVAILVVRALRAGGRPRLAFVIAVATIAVFAGYLAAGTPTLQLAWAAKILLFSVLAGWAVARLKPAPDVWISTYYGLALAAGANVLLGAWQRHEGWAGLVRLGLPYGERIRLAPSGDAVRAYGGFSTGAPFAYALALVALAWVGLAASGRDGRRLALWTAWVPVAAIAGIALSLNRIALVGLTAAGMAGAALNARRRPTIVLLAAAPLVVVAGVLLLAAPSTRSFLLRGFTFSSESAKTRRVLWREYGSALSAGGHGPGSAGAAYSRVAHGHAEDIELGRGWFRPERDPSGRRLNWMKTRGSLLVGTSGRSRRQTRVELNVTSLAVPRTLVVTIGNRRVAAVEVPARRSTLFQVLAPAGKGRLRLWLTADPPAARPGRISPRETRRLSVGLRSLASLDAGPPRTEAERIYAKARRALGPDALQGTAAGVVDNLYLSWLFQYGLVLGPLLCAVFVGTLLRPLLRAAPHDALVLTMGFWGAFLVVGAFAVNIWEEFPIDFIAAIGFAQLYAASSRSPSGRRGRRRARDSAGS